ncbi:MAG: UDP-glucose dehydrogenase family protein [Alphaproteobacteria bacterium]
MKVVAIGTGYVGLVTGVCYASLGVEVVCLDIDADKIALLESGQSPIFEPGLEGLMTEAVAAGNLTFTTDYSTALSDADIAIIAVGTPTEEGGSKANTRFVEAAFASILEHHSGELTVVVKSTVPIGTNDQLNAMREEDGRGASIHLASNPEFLREGAAIEDFMKPDRIVVGPRDATAAKALRTLNQTFINEGVAYVEVSASSAEMIKYAANAFLATKITFINEVASLCERVGANVEDVAHGIGLDQRIGPDFLSTGPGYGGSCFPKDTLALVDTAQVEGSPVRILEAVIDVNEARKQEMAEKVIQSLGGPESAKGKIVAIWGLTFKPNTDDLRDSPSIAIIPALQKAGIKIQAFDPQGMVGAATLFNDVDFQTSALDAAKGADAICLVTHWPEFAEIDLAQAKTAINSPRFIDLRNMFEPAAMAAAGWEYSSLGRPA